MTLAFLYPGQGSQAVGMGKALYNAFSIARGVFGEVDEALSQKLSKLMFEGPAEDLQLTENAQPALMAVSLAMQSVLEEQGKFPVSNARFLAGHSLGECSALCAGGALSLSDTAKLLKLRGQAMQKAVPVGMGAMAALIGLEFDAASSVAQEAAQGEVCQAANDNGGGQVVISGHKTAVERACEIAKAKGAKRALLLPVSAPFHCVLMQPAADAMKAALEKATINSPHVPVVANVTAQPVTQPADIRRLLVEQITGTVRWRESMEFMAREGVTTFVEIGAGKVLAGLVKRIAPEARSYSLGAPQDLDVFLKAAA
jgi:[acyl-carrier-protein] S-malonyltransferase